MSVLNIEQEKTTPFSFAEVTAALADAAQAYVYDPGGIAISAPLIIGTKTTPETFQESAADVVRSMSSKAASNDGSMVRQAVLDVLTEREVGIDCSGFVTSVLLRGLGSLGIDAFGTHVQYDDRHKGYPVPLDSFAAHGDLLRSYERRQQLRTAGPSNDVREDFDMQRIVDNSELVEGAVRAGDVILYSPSDEQKDPHRLGHVALILGTKGNRARVVHSGGKREGVQGGVQSLALPVAKLTHPAGSNVTPVVIRRLHALE